MTQKLEFLSLHKIRCPIQSKTYTYFKNSSVKNQFDAKYIALLFENVLHINS